MALKSILFSLLSPKKALNEVEEEALSICQSEDGHHNSLNFKSSINSDRSVQIYRFGFPPS